VYDGNAATVIGKRVGNYVVERTLAQGNMGSVFVARHPALGREAAVKFLGRDLDGSPEMTKRFLDEARITANLRHPNIVDIFDFGELDGRLYYVMELLEGVDLAGLMRIKQRFTSAEVVEMLRQVCSGLAAAHAVGVVHRDLKPGNIFVVQGQPSQLKLMDFGVAKILTTKGEQTHYGQIIGTPRYMSPEQALGQVDRVSAQSDIYSLGVIAYEMLAGRSPFEHQSPVMLLVMHVHHEVCPLDELAPGTPAWLVSLVESCLAKAPADRPASAKDILARIEKCQPRNEDARFSFSLPSDDTADAMASDANTAASLEQPDRATRADTASASMVSSRFPTEDADKSGIGETAGQFVKRLTHSEPTRQTAPSTAPPARDGNTTTAPPPPTRVTAIVEPEGDGSASTAPPPPPKVPTPAPPVHDATTATAASPAPLKSKSTAPPAPVAAPVQTRESRSRIEAKSTKAAPPAPATSVKTAVSAPVNPAVARQTQSSLQSQNKIAVRTTTAEVPAGLPGVQPVEATTSTLVNIEGGSGPSSEALSAVVTLTDADRTVLNRLLFRMQRKGDFPAFVQNVGEVSKRADFEGTFSAEQLGTAILKDYALTAKLLRIVNSAYANRFGGRIYSIRHAIVILGFERVRSLALSTSLFKNQGNKQHAGRISDSAINSLVSGEIARQVSSDAELDDPEQATVCSMFRNLGRHLVLVYLPELYDQIIALMEQQGIGMNLASERVLGLSMHKLGVGIAERWRLPAKIIASMSVVPERTGRITREEDKLAALADFSNQLCDIIVGEHSEETRSGALRTLLNRHKNLVQFEEDEIAELMDATQRSFEQRYASLLGVAAKQSRFARAVATMTGRELEAPAFVPRPEAPAFVPPPDAPAFVPPPEARAQTPSDPSQPKAVKKLELPANAKPAPTPVDPTPAAQRAAKPKVQVMRLQLAKVVEPENQEGSEATVSSETSLLDSMVARVLNDAQAAASEQLLVPMLRAISEELKLPRLLALRATQSRRELVVVGGAGDDIDGISKELRIPLSAARNASDPFSLCYHARRDYLIEDVFAAKVSSSLPQRYFEVIGSTCLGLLYCGTPTTQTVVLTMDVEPPHRLPTQQELERYARVRVALSKIAPAAAL
jgi:serine/threonine-protein kinase